MKKFGSSAIGKLLCCMLITVCVAAMLLSLFAISVAVREEYYNKTEDELIAEVTTSQYIDEIDSYILSWANSNESGGNVPRFAGMELQIEDDLGEVVYKSAGYDSMELAEAIDYSIAVAVGDDGYVCVADGPENDSNTQGDIFAFMSSFKGVKLYSGRLKLSAAFYGSSERVSMAKLLYSLRYTLIAVAALSLAAAVILFAVLMHFAGRRPGDDIIHTSALTGFPFDLEVFLYLCLVGTVFALISEISCRYDSIIIISVVLGYLVCAAFGLWLAMGFAAKVKLHALGRGLLVTRAFRTVKELLAALPLVWRTGVIAAAAALLEWLLCSCAFRVVNHFAVFLLIALHICIACTAIYLALILRRLQKAGEAISAGDFEYKTDTKGLWWEFGKHAETLNAVSGTVSKAVAESLKSERMKTELITNVSHDIKTPLTSIINYSSMIAEKTAEDDELHEHSEVLIRQSDKLRRLLDDLVEASRANSGNLDVALQPCDAEVFVTQAAGEYEERLSAAGLTLVTKVPEEELRIMADPRRMWRIFDNLMNNACKYSADGTRVYLTLEKRGDKAVISFKNTSRAELDIDPDELMERFVRGDSSRSTEGSGLGLSIARSFAELQGGRLNLTIDGDLFKAFLVFPTTE